LESSPFQIIRKFVTDAIITDIVEESNRFVQQVKETKPKAFNQWKDLSPNEFWRFIAVTIMMGLVKKSAIKDYWSIDPFFATPFFGQVMTRNR